MCCLDVLDDCVEVSLVFQDGDFVKGFRSNKAVESRYNRGADVMRLLLRRRDHDVIGGRSRSTQLPSWKFQGNILYCHVLNRSDHNFASVLATRDACDPELRERLRTNDCPDLQSGPIEAQSLQRKQQPHRHEPGRSITLGQSCRSLFVSPPLLVTIRSLTKFVLLSPSLI